MNQMMLEEKFIQSVSRNNLFGRNDRLIIAVSGGVDSVVLCELCSRSGYHFEIAHVNFQLRGEESNADEKFVENLAEKYRVPIHVMRSDTLTVAASKGVSVQVAARDIRYEWFDRLLEKKKGLLLTAHHADDNIETQIMHFFRGTGIHGLRGIPEKTGYKIRPLLHFTKEEIRTYAQYRELNWREDSSNASEKYSRNYFRNTIIPLIEKIYPSVEQNLLENARRFSEIELLYEQAIAANKKNLLTIKGEEVHLPVLKLKKVHPLRTVLYEIVQPYHFTSSQLDDIVHLLDAAQGKMVYSASHRIIRNRNWLIIAPRNNSGGDNILIENGDTRVSYAHSEITLGVKPIKEIQIHKRAEEAMLDARQLEYPLILRKWKEGDYFYPLGMPKKKKIARFLIDQKLSRTQKENCWVLESNKRICWIVGMRIDERFKITPSTREVVVIKNSNNESPHEKG